MSEPKFLKKQYYFPIVALCMLIFIGGSLSWYRENLAQELNAVSCEVLDNILEQQRFTFASKLQGQSDDMKIYAQFFESPSGDSLQEQLDFITRNSTFDTVNYVDRNGNTLKNTGQRLNVADRDYFLRAMEGESVIADPIISRVTGSSIVTFATPIYRNGKVDGALVGVYNSENLFHLLMPSFNGRGYTYITTNAGEIIAKTNTSSSLASYNNLFDALDIVGVYELDDSHTIRANASRMVDGHSRYLHDGEARMMHYGPVGINDWYIFSVAPVDAISPQSIGIMSQTTLIVLVVSVIFALSILYIYITQRKHLQELQQTAFVDSLTGGPNRQRFTLNSAELLKTTTPYAFVLLDVDKFKVLNDTLGYQSGDAVLKTIGRTLTRHLGADEAFGRGGSDKHYILMRYTNDGELRTRIQTMIEEIEHRFRQNIDTTYNLVLCVGVYVITTRDKDINILGDRARHAHRLIKGRGASSIAFYNEEIRNRILAEKEVENHMHAALKNKEFLLYLQPKYLLHTRKICGAEALVRWQGGNNVFVYPDQFILVFERNGFVTKLDMYMLEAVCITLRNWIDQGITPIPISINFSRLHLRNPNFVSDIAAAVERYRIPPHLIEVELTESAMLDNESLLIRVLEQLHEHGFTLSMDDFGSGYSSLGLLKNLPVDVVKLDKTFLSENRDRERARTVIASMIQMARNLDICTVAEGVETQAQIDLLTELGCDIVQGFYFARPMPLQDLDLLLKE